MVAVFALRAGAVYVNADYACMHLNIIPPSNTQGYPHVARQPAQHNDQPVMSQTNAASLEKTQGMLEATAAVCGLAGEVSTVGAATASVPPDIAAASASAAEAALVGQQRASAVAKAVKQVRKGLNM